MLELVAFFAVVASIYFAHRYSKMKRAIRHMADAVERRRVYLLSELDQEIFDAGVKRLARVYNELLEESIDLSRDRAGSLNQWETTLRNLAESVVIVDSDFTLLLANISAIELFRIEEQYEGNYVERYIRSSSFLEYVENCFKGESLSTSEIEVRNGSEMLHLELTGGLIDSRSKGNKQLGIFVLHDITRLRRLETIRKEFVANVSHELRTPVTIIKGFAEALAEDLDQLPAHEVKRFLGKIQRNVERLHSLLEDLLTLSRLEKGRDSLNINECALHQIIYDVVEGFQNQLHPDTHTIEFDLDPDVQLLQCDCIKISQVISNIIDNSIRYAKGFDHMKIATHNCPETGVVEISISDNGCGIPSKDIPHIFERFYRVDKGRSRELGGTGLGLSIVKHIVQLHGGKIRVDSEEGKGTCMVVSLPALQKAAA